MTLRIALLQQVSTTMLPVKWPLCVFEPLLGERAGLRATYAVHLRLIGKPVVDVLVIIELFPLGAMVEALRVNILIGNCHF